MQIINIDYQQTRTLFKDGGSDFIHHFIWEMIRRNGSISITECFNYIDDPNKFDYFRMYQLFRSTKTDSQIATPLKAILEKVYNKKIRQANFRNAITQNGERYNITRNESLLSEIFEKFEFLTDPEILIDMLWMDQSGITNFSPQTNHPNQKISLAQKILSKLAPSEIDKAKDEILKRLIANIT